jgi:hypothetical protein
MNAISKLTFFSAASFSAAKALALISASFSAFAFS